MTYAPSKADNSPSADKSWHVGTGQKHTCYSTYYRGTLGCQFPWLPVAQLHAPSYRLMQVIDVRSKFEACYWFDAWAHRDISQAVSAQPGFH